MQYKLTTSFNLNSYTAKQVGIVLPDDTDDNDRFVIIGTYRQLIKLAAQLRYEFINANGYNPIFVTRAKGYTAYTVMAHFGMPQYRLATIERL